jgi:hypothetical protein
VKFQRTDSFKSDWRRLSEAERELFRFAIKHFHIAAERVVVDPRVHWPGSLRVKRVVSAPGIWEMTWSFSGPDGRATFEWVEIDGTSAIRWRRISTQRSFANRKDRLDEGGAAGGMACDRAG